MNVLFVTTSIGFGGAAKSMILVAGELVRRGHKVEFFNLVESSDVRRPSKQVKVFPFVRSRISCFSPRLDQLLQLRRRVLQFDADVVVGFKSLPNFLVGILRYLTKIPGVMSERADPFREDSSSVKSKIRRFFIDHCDGGVFQLENARLGYGKKLQKNGVVIPNIILPPDEDLKETIKFPKEKVVVSIGRFENRQKRYDVMLDAFSLFSKKHPDYVLKLYGTGEDEQLIEKWIREKGLESKVFIKGFTPQPLQEIVKAEIFLITSDYEGISNSLLEAMSVGAPVVSTDSTPGGARSLIEDHKNGLLVPCGSPQKIADALCEYAEDRELEEVCGSNARKIVELFSLEDVCNKWEEYLYQIVSERE